MEVKYKSSILATYFYYLIYVILIVVSLFFAYKAYVFSLNNDSANGFNLFFLPFIAWALVISFLKIYKLKYVEVKDENILIGSLIGKKILEYKDIEWVHINNGKAANRESIILIKYKNINTNKFNIIYFLPKTEIRTNGLVSERVSNELEITKFIKDRIVSFRSDFNSINEPSGWYFDKIYFIALVPSAVIFLFLLIK